MGFLRPVRLWLARTLDSQSKKVGSTPTRAANLWWHWCNGSIVPCEGTSAGSTPVCHPNFILGYRIVMLYMRTQEQIQYDVNDLVEELSKRKQPDPAITFGEAVNGFPDLKEKWEAILNDVADLKTKGTWRA